MIIFRKANDFILLDWAQMMIENGSNSDELAINVLVRKLIDFGVLFKWKNTTRFFMVLSFNIIYKYILLNLSQNKLTSLHLFFWIFIFIKELLARFSILVAHIETLLLIMGVDINFLFRKRPIIKNIKIPIFLINLTNSYNFLYAYGQILVTINFFPLLFIWIIKKWLSFVFWIL